VPLPSTTRGLAAHLALACFSVAALALAANSLVRQGTLVVQTIEMPGEEARGDGSESPLVEHVPVDSAALVASVQRHSLAVLERAESPAGASDASMRAARNELRRELDNFIAVAGNALPARDARAIRTAVQRSEHQAEELVRYGDARRALLQSCWSQLDTLDRNQREAIERAWKIFGRVLARESLLEVGRELNVVRSHLARFAQPQGYSTADITALETAEANLITALHPGQASVSRERQAWLQSNQDLVHTMSAARESLVDTDQRMQRLGVEFRRDNGALERLARKPRFITVTVRPAREATTASTRGDAAAVVRTTSTELDPPWHRTALLAVSAAAVLVLLALSAQLFIRVVGPVRRLVQAARGIADGDTGQRVRRGGIRELDSLAVAFNQMAERLDAAQAVAREYQQRLEATVEQRTRQLLHLAAHDPLTELPNRRELFEQLAAAVGRARDSGKRVGVFVLDVDNFKNLNDSVGHAYGDRVLQAVARRLAETTSSSGYSARLGGDEFTVILEDAPDLETIGSAGQELVRAFHVPLEIDGRELVLSISIGASCYPEHGEDAESLLRAADAALFRAKALGRSQLSLYTPDLLTAAATRFTTEQGLRLALERNDLELVFQPEVDTRTLGVGLVETLLRWRLPDGRLATPGEFLAVAEESGLILGISDWVLRSAIETADAWRRGPWPEVRVAINVSVRQVLDHGFENRLLSLLERHALPAQCIELELTENVLQTGRATIQAIGRLRAAGIGIALDDFGTGYSSLASLEHLPLTRVKLDQSLVASIDTNARSLAITLAIASLCEQLGLEMTAEGVERPEQLALLLPHASICLQGFLISRPVSREDLPARVAELPARLQSLLLSSEVMRTAGTRARTAATRAVRGVQVGPDRTSARRSRR
jgi:diguanylate cyclase (GGDEF)-like protein